MSYRGFGVPLAVTVPGWQLPRPRPVPAIPDSQIARDATELIRSVESDPLYYHSLRVFSWAALRGALRGTRYDPELVYVGAMFHDIGLVEGASQRA